MNKETLKTLILHPSKVNAEDKGELIDLVKAYPYFSIAHLLLLNNLYKTKNTEFDQQLLASALNIGDRGKLFNLIHSVDINDISKRPVRNEIKITNVVDSPDDIHIEPHKELSIEHTDFLLEENEPVESLSEQQFQSPIKNTESRSDLLDLDETPEKPVYAEESPREVVFETEATSPGKFHLIDKFLEDIPVFTPARIVPEESQKDIAAESIKEDEECVTETLAAIYMNQQLFESAISVYNKLILKYPEKSIYFADRIEEIKKLLK